MAINAMSAGRKRPVWSTARAVGWVAVLVVAVLAYLAGATWLILGNDHYHELSMYVMVVGYVLVHLTDDHDLPIPRPLVLPGGQAWVGGALKVGFDPQGRVVTARLRTS